MRQLVKLLGLSCGFLMTACGGGEMMAGDECGPGTVSGAENKFATSAIRLPTSAMGYSLDIDGDGRADNQLKAIIGAIASANFDLQGPVDEAVKDGDAVILASVQAADLTSGCAKTTLALAKQTMTPPKFDGTDVFTIDPGQTPATLYGKITGGKLSTTLPKEQKGDQVQKIQLNLPLAMGNLPLAIYGAHLQGTVTATGVMAGELHGVILKTDVDGQIIPAVAQLLTEQIRKDPNSGTVNTIIKLFEDPMGNPASAKKCTDTPTKCCAMPANRPTCEITAEEVRTNALIGNVLAADVQVRQGGTWSPVPKAPVQDRDAMSVGLGFVGTKASF